MFGLGLVDAGGSRSPPASPMTSVPRKRGRLPRAGGVRGDGRGSERQPARATVCLRECAPSREEGGARVTRWVRVMALGVLAALALSACGNAEGASTAQKENAQKADAICEQTQDQVGTLGDDAAKDRDA